MNDFKKKLEKKLRDPEYKAKWDAYDPEYQVIKTLIEARRKKNVTQKQLAEMTGITQPDISRLENGRGNPSLRTLNNLAKGLGMALWRSRWNLLTSKRSSFCPFREFTKKNPSDASGKRNVRRIFLSVFS